MLAMHPTTAVGTEIYDNFYYLPPEDLMSNVKPMAVLRYWLGTLAERKRTEQALEENRRRLQALFDNALDAILLADDEMRYVDANPAACALLGYCYEELLQLTVRDVTPAIDREQAQAAWQAFIAEGKQSGEYILLCKDGTTVEVEFRAVANISPGLHLSILRDITERKRAEERLREYEKVVEGLEEMIVVVDREYRYLIANQAFLNYRGLEREQVVGRLVPEVINQEVFEQVIKEKLNEALQGKVVKYELKYTYPELGERELFLSYFPIEGPDGVDRVVCILQDITGRKRAEAEIRRHTARMEALSGISQALAEVGLDTQAVFETIARYTAEIIGDVSRLALLSSDEQWFQPVAFHHANPEIRALMESIYPFTPISAAPEWFAHILRTGQGILIPVVDQEQFRQNVQPEYRPFFEQVGVHSILNVPLRAEGRVIGTLGLTRDQPGRPYTPDDQVLLQALADRVALTIENARLFEQVQGAHKRLQALSRRLLDVQEAERRHIARELHDEIGQVLHGLKLLLDMTARLPAETARSRLGEAQQLVNELMEQVDELSLDLRPAMLDDLGLLPALLGHFERYSQQTNIQVTFQQTRLEGRRFSPDMETTVFRLIQEGLTNVARHAGVDEVIVRLWVSLDALGVEIEDQGAGFGPQAKRASSGLSGMRERVVLLGGQLTIESAPGSGTTITAELPLPDSTERSGTDDHDHSGR